MFHGRSTMGNQGIALLAALFMVLAVSLLGMTALHLAAQEIDSAAALRNDAAGLHVAEAGADLVIGWMHEPSAIPSEELRQMLMKRSGSDETGPSFFDAEGRSQFRGTSDRPDVWFDARRPADNELLNDPARGWFRALSGVGRVTQLKVYAPSQPDLLCTVEVAAVGPGRESDATRTVRVQLAAFPMPPMRSAVRVGALPALGTTASSVLVHWGDLHVVGDAAVRNWGEVPSRSSLAPVTGQSYREMRTREDRWHEMKVGGSLTVMQPDAQDRGMPLNVADRQVPVPGLRMDHWDYHQLKRLAQTHGSYYVVDGNGRLHLGAIAPGERGTTLDEVMRSVTVGDHRGLVFVDTLDQQPPRSDNLAQLTAEAPYAEGLFVVNAHVSWTPSETGASISVLTPPTGETSSLGARVPVSLSRINLNGVLYVSGSLKVGGGARGFGSVATDGPLTTSGTGLEVWFNYDLRSGSYRGLPLVTVAPGSWRAV